MGGSCRGTRSSAVPEAVSAIMIQMDRDEPTANRSKPRRIAAIGLVVSAALAGVKLVAGILGHSFALVADAVESFVDVLGSAMVWSAMRYGDRPADAEHPFGHGKAEALAGLAVAILVMAAGVGIAVEAVRQIATPHTGPRPFTLAVLVTVIIIKELLARAAGRAARDAGGSSAGTADAWHHRSDAITSAFAFVGIAVALAGGAAWARADDVAALLASVVILFNGLRIARGPWDELLDRQCSSIAEEAARVALADRDVRGVERCEARRSGRGYRIVMHVEVDGAMSVDSSHCVTGRVKAAIRSHRGEIDTVLIHVEPYVPAACAEE